MRSSSSLITTTLFFECRSIPLNFMWASFGLKRDRTLTLAPPLPRGEEARYMIIIARLSSGDAEKLQRRDRIAKTGTVRLRQRRRHNRAHGSCNLDPLAFNATQLNVTA